MLLTSPVSGQRYPGHNQSQDLHGSHSARYQTLTWTPAQAFSYFRNALRNDADDWLHCIMDGHPEFAHTWTIFRPLFSQKYDVQAIPHTFIHKIVNLTLASCDNKLDKYYQKVGETINSAKESFIHPDVEFPDGNDTFAAAHKPAQLMATLFFNLL